MEDPYQTMFKPDLNHKGWTLNYHKENSAIAEPLGESRAARALILNS